MALVTSEAGEVCTFDRNVAIFNDVTITLPRFTGFTTVNELMAVSNGWSLTDWAIAAANTEGSWVAWWATEDRGWISGNTTTWLRITFPQAVTLKSYSFRTSRITSRWSTRIPRIWSIQGSVNNIAWTTVDSFTKTDWGRSPQGTVFTFYMGNYQSFKHWRINITAGNGHDDVIIEQLRMHVTRP